MRIGDALDHPPSDTGLLDNTPKRPRRVEPGRQPLERGGAWSADRIYIDEVVAAAFISEHSHGMGIALVPKEAHDIRLNPIAA